MKLNDRKCFFMITGESVVEEICIDTGYGTIQNSQEQRGLVALIYTNLSFKKHISNLCRNAGNPLCAISCMCAYLETDKVKLLMKAFVTSQLHYCPLVWILYVRKMNNNTINKLHEKA